MIRKTFVLAVAIALSACQSAPPTRPVAQDASPRDESAQLTTLSPALPEYVETGSLADVKSFADTIPYATSLVVFDIDDTLLSTPMIEGRKDKREFFGSDSWYGWQSSLDEMDAYKLPKTCLFDFLAINYETGTQQATEEKVGGIVDGVSADKVFLTSRSPDYRGGTERELAQAKIKLPSQLTLDPNVFVRRPDGTAMTYINGIYMTKGANKGEALVALLQKLNLSHKYSDVVLVDDGWKNIQQMSAALSARGIRFHGFLYTGIKKDPAAGTTSPSQVDIPHLDKAISDAAVVSWTNWFAALRSAYPLRAKRFEVNKCPK